MSAVTKIESARLERAETIIEQGISAYRAAGDALREIRDERLYKESYVTFEDYCLSRWGWTPQHSGRLIAASEVANNLEPIGSIPATESQARPLTKLESPDLQRAAYGVAETIAEQNKAGKVTAKDVKKAVDLVHEVIAENPNIKPEAIAAKAVEKGAIEEVEEYDPAEHELQEAHATILTLAEENQKLKDLIAVGNLPEPEQTAGEIIADLRGQVKTLEAVNSALTSSRDGLQREVAQLKKQCQMQRNQLKKLGA